MYSVNNMKKFKKKPIVIEAIQLKWDAWSEVCDFVGVGKLSDNKPCGFNLDGDPSKIGLYIPTLEGVMEANEGDWIIKGIQGEFYPCKPDIFEATYEEVIEAKRDPKCTCGDPSIKEHACPYRQDIDDDNDYKCICCDFCTNECIKEI